MNERDKYATQTYFNKKGGVYLINPEMVRPCIGICVGPTQENIRKIFHHLVKIRLAKYATNPFEDIIVFTLDGLNLSECSLTGHRALSTERGLRWVTGTYSLPNVIYVQSEFKYDELKTIEQVLPGKIFNNHFYDKMECWSILSQNLLLKPNLPKSKLLETPEDIGDYLGQFRSVYLKPILGHSGKGIIKTKLLKNGQVERFCLNENKLIQSIHELYNWITTSISTDPYMVQQGIETATWKGNPTDIRLNMNKNGKGDWEVSFLVARIALNQPFVSTGSQHNVLSYIEPYLTRIFPNKDTVGLKQSIIDLGYEICRTFDGTKYHMAEFGIDIGVDPFGKLWIFEVNHLPHPFHKLPDKSLTLPFDYAYYLTQKN